MAARKTPTPGYRPPFDLAVSLGYDRQVAYQLRGTAPTIEGPFDWLTTPFAGLMRALQQDFAGFMAPENLVRCPGADHVVCDIRYGVLAANDFTASSPLNATEVQDKYRLAVNRFRNVMQSHRPVLFVRHNIERHEAAELIDFLSRLNPAFRLLALTNTPEKSWELPFVTNARLKPFSRWEGDDDAWAKLLAPFHVDREGARDEPKGVGPRRSP